MNLPIKKLRSATNRRSNNKKTVNVLSMFSGCGGLDLGFLGGFEYMGKKYLKHGFHIAKAFDNDSKAVETYTKNIGAEIELADLATFPAEDMPTAEVLIGGFPCQEFSSCGPLGGLKADRGRLYLALVEYMQHHQPLVVVAENVINLGRMQNGDVLRTIIADFESAGCGYRFTVWRLFAPDYGIPQFRHRLFLVGIRNDLPGEIEQPKAKFRNNHKTINWAIADLENIKDESIPNQSQYFLASKAKRGNGQGDETNRIGEPSYCIRANPKSRVQFHYRLKRRLTVRECARLQTFPDQFEFFHSTTANISQIGNAVPPLLAHAVAKSVKNYITSPELAKFLPSTKGQEAQGLLFR